MRVVTSVFSREHLLTVGNEFSLSLVGLGWGPFMFQASEKISGSSKALPAEIIRFYDHIPDIPRVAR